MRDDTLGRGGLTRNLAALKQPLEDNNLTQRPNSPAAKRRAEEGRVCGFNK